MKTLLAIGVVLCILSAVNSLDSQEGSPSSTSELHRRSSHYSRYDEATYYEEEYDDSYYDYEDYDEDYYEDYEDYYEDYDEYDEYEDYDDYDDYDGEDDENNLTTILEQEEKLIRMLSGRSTAQSYNSGFERYEDEDYDYEEEEYDEDYDYDEDDYYYDDEYDDDYEDYYYDYDDDYEQYRGKRGKEGTDEHSSEVKSEHRKLLEDGSPEAPPRARRDGSTKRDCEHEESISQLAAQTIELERAIQKKIAERLDHGVEDQGSERAGKKGILENEMESAIEEDIDSKVQKKLRQATGQLPDKVRSLERNVQELKQELENSPWKLFQRLMMEHAVQNNQVDVGLTENDFDKLSRMHKMTANERKAFMKLLRKKASVSSEADEEQDDYDDYDDYDDAEPLATTKPKPSPKNKSRKKRPKKGRSNKLVLLRGDKEEENDDENDDDDDGELITSYEEDILQLKKSSGKKSKGKKSKKKRPINRKREPWKGGKKKTESVDEIDEEIELLAEELQNLELNMVEETEVQSVEGKGKSRGKGKKKKVPKKEKPTKSKKKGPKRKKRSLTPPGEWQNEESQDSISQINNPSKNERKSVPASLQYLLKPKVVGGGLGEKATATPTAAPSTAHEVTSTPANIQQSNQPSKKNKRSSPEQCDKCEERVGEEVCGSNGKTYNSLCHAVHCGRLREMDVRFGSCEGRDPCAHHHCSESEVCAAMTYGPCLSVYTSAGRKLPCRQYICVAKEDCGHTEYSEVCGVDGTTYSTLCHLQQRGVKLAYSGPCRPALCHGAVCGRDGVTYPSSCHARAHNVRVDYKGTCFAEDLEDNVKSCSDVRAVGLCSLTSCPNPVIPDGACCPICGGGVEVDPESSQLAELARDWPEINHLYMVENFLRRLVPREMESRCDLSLTLTDTGAIMLVLEAVEERLSPTCQAAAMEVAENINSPSGDRGTVVVARKARLLSGMMEGMMRDSVRDQADLITSDIDNMKSDTTYQMTNSYNDRMESIDNYASGGNSLLAPVITVITLAAATLALL